MIFRTARVILSWNACEIYREISKEMNDQSYWGIPAAIFIVFFHE